jgi:hypothetical protein
VRAKVAVARIVVARKIAVGIDDIEHLTQTLIESVVGVREVDVSNSINKSFDKLSLIVIAVIVQRGSDSEQLILEHHSTSFFLEAW